MLAGPTLPQKLSVFARTSWRQHGNNPVFAALASACQRSRVGTDLDSEPCGNLPIIGFIVSERTIWS
jgi:hypothetical protein